MFKPKSSLFLIRLLIITKALAFNTNKMKFILLILISTFSICSYAQDKYIVTAENGLLLRNEPNTQGEKIGKLYFGAEVKILEITKNTQTINDGDKKISGTWVKVKFKNYPTFISNNKFGYVFNGYLMKKTECFKEIKQEILNYPELKNLTINDQKAPFYLRGDFFGDKTEDLVVLLKNSDGITLIGIINYGIKTKIYILGGENDPFKISNYGWVDIFDKINPGEVLWSNYEDDYIDFKDVPENKKIRLKYDALYMHASESCGGGFVFWKNGKFNWLQQE